MPIPDTVRDAVLIGVSDLSPEGRAAAGVAAVAGEEFDLAVVAGTSSSAGLAELLMRELVTEAASGRGAFRHALAREALYADVPWIERRQLHVTLAEAVEATGGTSIEVAGHWLAAREETRARVWLVEAAEASRRVHAHRDVARALRQALELWPAAEGPEHRIGALESYAQSAELSGEVTEAARAWREICAVRAEHGNRMACAQAQRRLAAVHELRADRDAAFAARNAAAEAFAAEECLAEAAVERLALANYLRAGANYSASIDLALTAATDAGRAGRLDLRLRALGLQGVAQAKGGDYERGLATVREGLAQALEHDLTEVSADLYQRLSMVLYDAGDYPGANDMIDRALALCPTGDEGPYVACITCLVYVLRERGQWTDALRLGRDLIDSGTAVPVAEGLVGSIHGLQGRLTSARRLLSSSLATASRLGHFNMAVDATAALARVDAAEGDVEAAADRCRSLWRAGGAARTTTTPSRGCASGRRSAPAAATCRRLTAMRSRSRRSPPRPATPTRSPPSPTPSASWRWPTETPTRRQSRWAARSPSIAIWICRSPAPRSSSGPGWRWRQPANASLHSTSLPTPTALPESSVRGRWPPRPPARWRPWASRWPSGSAPGQPRTPTGLA